MYLQDAIDTLKRIRLSLIKFEDTTFQNCVMYLNMAIKSLEDYKNNPGQLERQMPPHLAQIPVNSNTSSTKDMKSLLNQATPYCGVGKHWVNRTLKNGEPGYCRKNPQRNKIY